MNTRLSKWKTFCATPEFIKSVNGWFVWFWLANFPPVIWLYVTVESGRFQTMMLLYLALVSIWANVAGHFSAWVAGRVEVKQDKGN